MGVVLTCTPSRTTLPQAAPVRLQIVARWKAAKEKNKMRPRKSNPSARRHVGCTTYPEMPPPPPQYIIVKEAGASSSDKQ